MSSVVLRCPNCGTTRATPGPCEACHAAEVRPYCTNHTPGLWLDGPACPQCGARLGEPDRPAPAPRPAPRPGVSPPPRRPAAPRAAPRPERREEAPEEEIFFDPRGARGRPVTSLQDLLRAAVQARARGGARLPPDSGPREDAPRVKSPGGCFVRFVFLMVFLFLAMVGGMMVLGGSVLRLFVPF